MITNISKDLAHNIFSGIKTHITSVDTMPKLVIWQKIVFFVKVKKINKNQTFANKKQGNF